METHSSVIRKHESTCVSIMKIEQLKQCSMVETVEVEEVFLKCEAKESYYFYFLFSFKCRSVLD